MGVFYANDISAQTPSIKDCNPNLSGLSNGSFLPLDEQGKEVIRLSVNNIGFSAGTFMGSGKTLLTSVNAASASIDVRQATPGKYELYFVVDKYAHPDCQLGVKSEVLNFAIDGNIAEQEVDVLKKQEMQKGQTLIIKPTASSLTYSKPEFRYHIDEENTTAKSAKIDKHGKVTASSSGVISVSVTEINLLSASSPTYISIQVK